MKVQVLILLFLVFSCSSCENDEEVKTETFKLQLQINPEEGGRVEVLNIETNTSASNLNEIPKGTKIKFVATPAEGYVFAGFWENNKFLSAEINTMTMFMNRDIEVVFKKPGRNPVETFGNLSVESSKIVDENSVPIQLKGMSFFWSQWMGKYWNADVVNTLATDWEANIVRAAMGVDADGGYLYNQTEKRKVETIVDAAIDKGIYVIIDWHSHHAEDYPEEAVAFFTEMAKKYGEYPNVIYEIYNEPLDVSWSNTIKPYAEKVINAIRVEDPDNIILVGTPRWCQSIDDVVGNTISGKNIAYVFHFYASEPAHQNLFSKVERAIDNGIPVFVTEWGVSEASGNGNFNRTWTKQWLDFMDKHKLSWCNWSVADKAETSAALKPAANANGIWNDDDLSASGTYIKNLLKTNQGYSNPK